MHELSICQALLDQVHLVAGDSSSERVLKIVIAIGPLAGVEPGLMASAFAVMKIGSFAAQAALIIEAVGVEVECSVCGTISAAAANRLICAACGGYRTRVVAGQELRLLRVEMLPAESPQTLN